MALKSESIRNATANSHVENFKSTHLSQTRTRIVYRIGNRSNIKKVVFKQRKVTIYDFALVQYLLMCHFQSPILDLVT